MSRYGRAVYGTAKYGLDLWSEYSVEPMVASITVDADVFAQASSFTDPYGATVYNRVQVSWLEPHSVSRMLLLRSNLGYPTSPNDPFSTVLADSQIYPGLLTYPGSDFPGYDNNNLVVVHNISGDPSGRTRWGFLDKNVIPGREYFYAVWVYIGAPTDEWVLAGRAFTTTSNDHGTLDALKGALPPYIWGRYGGPGDGTSVLADDDDEDYLTKWLQSCAWELDQSLTKLDLLRNVWDPQYTPAVLLDEAVGMYGLPVEPALGERAQRALLTNAATITADRGTVDAISRLVESLTGFSCPPIAPNSQGYNNKGGISFGSNLICNTDESSFEGLGVSSGTLNVVSGTGRWYFTNASLTRIRGDSSNSSVNIARDPNSDDEWGPSVRYGIHADAVSLTTDIGMSLGEKVKISSYTPGTGYADVVTSWAHGLAEGDTITISLDGGTTTYSVTVLYLIDSLTVRIGTVAGMPSVVTNPSNGYFSGGMIPVYQGIPVVQNLNYSLVGKFMSNSSNASNLSLKMNYYDRFGNFLSSIQVTPGTMSPAVTIPVESDNGWTQVYVSGSSPANAAAATLVIDLPQSGVAQYLDVDSLMVKSGGTPYNDPLVYTNSTAYNGAVDYTYEDARLMTITIDTTTTSASPLTGNVPTTIQADLIAVIQARLVSILAAYIPVGTAFQVKLI